MIDDLKTGLNLAMGVVDLAKGIKDLSDKSDDLDFKEASQELRSQTIDLKEAVNDMRGTIIELEKKLKFNEKLSFNGKVFEYEDNGQKVYICNGCESNGQYVHMTERLNNGGHSVICPTCKNIVTLIEGKIHIKTQR